MRRAALLIAMLATVAAAQDPKRKAADDPPEKVEYKKVPDKSWVPKPGDRALIARPQSPACTSYAAYDRYVDLMKAKDDVGVKQLIDAGRVFMLDEGVGVLVIKRHRPNLGPVAVSAREYDRMLQEAILSPRFPEPLEARITDGDREGQLVFLPEECVHRLKEVPVPPEPKPKEKPRPKPVDPAARAASLLNQATALEKQGKKDAALSYYRDIVAKYPGTEAAEKAAERVKAMGRK